MHDYALAHAIATDPGLQQRIRGLLRVKAPACTPIERALLDRLPVDLLTDAVAGNSSVLAQVRTQVTAAGEAAAVSVSEAIEAVPDSDVEYVVLTQLTFLQ